MTMNSSNNQQQPPPPIILRYPGQRADEWSYAVLKPSNDDPEVWVIASSWFDDLEQAKGLS